MEIGFLVELMKCPNVGMTHQYMVSEEVDTVKCHIGLGEH